MDRSRPTRGPPQEETIEERAAFGKYIGWKRLLKYEPVPGDVKTMRALWYGALQILNSGRKDLQQFVPRDLESATLLGREHMEALMNLEVDEEASKTFLSLVKPFLQVITHPILLNCLAVDTAVGCLYNFFGGSNGSRAVPFLEQVLKCLKLCHEQSDELEPKQSNIDALFATAVSLRELLRREERSRSHHGLPNLAISIETSVKVLKLEVMSVAYQVVTYALIEIRGMAAQALEPNSGRVKLRADMALQTADTEFGSIVFPCGIHDNDKRDITEIIILPTEDEVRCTHEEFLPSTDIRQPHFLDDPVSRHLDTYFRLYRHDIIGELKANLGSLLASIESNPALLNSPRLNLNNMRAFSFPGATVKDITFHDKRGLEALLSFPQPQFVQKIASAGDRSKVWTESKRLEQGVLLCLLYYDGEKCSMLLFTVSEKKLGQKADLINLSSDPDVATIHAKLATGLQSDLEKLMQINCKGTQGFLVELPGVIPATFVPVLENLQNMQRNYRLPFQKWILPRIPEEEQHTIPPPLYARAKDFAFSLKSILRTECENLTDLCFCPTASAKDNSLIGNIEARTHLDKGQCIALIEALSSEFALIQGPPGTGKSYLGVNLMRVLLDASVAADLGPIIVVCYTNHALDQFLEHLMGVGIQNVIRIGGRSSSTILASRNLHEMSRNEIKTRPEATAFFQNKQKLEKEMEPLQNYLKTLKGVRTRPMYQDIVPHLADRYPLVHSQLSLDVADGFQIAGRHPFEIWLAPQDLKHEDLQLRDGQNDEEIDTVIEEATKSIQSISVRNRRRLLAHWVAEIQDSLADHIYESAKRCESYMQETRNVYDEVSRRTLQAAAVIGVTTTGLAKHIAILRHIPSKVIICEEAGEIMEPHMISALLPSVEHVISIGDHQQLRPTIQNFGLSLESYQGPLFQLDRSQFERLATGGTGQPGLPVAQLNIQRRMRPEISRLIRKTIYPSLLDHKSIQNLPDVVGLKNNVFWLDHTVFEDKSNEEILQRERLAGWDKYNRELVDKSHKNSWEVDMVHALVRHLVRQGVYSSEEIAVLTPYTGQLRALRNKFHQEFEVVLNERDEDELEKEDEANEERLNSRKLQSRTQKKSMSRMLRLATVDNFQGEEAKVILISLVRSNNNRQVGFLKTTNRINVLLSRAQHGMYLIGNTDTYSRVQMWNDVLEMLYKAGSVGNAFNLCCSRHPEKVIQASKPEDFAQVSPEGGCTEKCGQSLQNCGHVCQSPCHSDRMHSVARCSEPCTLTLKLCGHQCGGYCSDICRPCNVKVKGTLPCGHESDQIECHTSKNPINVKCKIQMEKEVSGCKHLTIVACHENVKSPFFKCPEACGAVLPCGHTCPIICGGCKAIDGRGRIVLRHTACKRPCDKKSAKCGHNCTKTCHGEAECDDGSSCQLPCKTSCVHMSCAAKCSEACIPCLQKCTWYCEHEGECNQPCAGPCDRLPCNKRCTVDLPCGHQCPGLCGEVCLENHCQNCSLNKSIAVDGEKKTLEEVDLDETPIVLLGCGHLFTYTYLDQALGLSDAYIVGDSGAFENLKFSGVSNSAAACPACYLMIRRHTVNRYNRLINLANANSAFKIWFEDGMKNLQLVASMIEQLEDKFDLSRPELILTARSHRSRPVSQETMADLEQKMMLRPKIENFLEEKVLAVRDTIRQGQPQPLPSPRAEARLILLGQFIHLKGTLVVLADRLGINRAFLESGNSGLSRFVGPGLEQLCATFLQRCRETMQNCLDCKLFRAAIQLCLLFLKMTKTIEAYVHCTNGNMTGLKDLQNEARDQLNKVANFSKGLLKDTAIFESAIKEAFGLLANSWYTPISPAEITNIKAALRCNQIQMGSEELLFCAEGHPYTAGEWVGLSMNIMRCTECGK